jgi:transcription elongation factor Elf1
MDLDEAPAFAGIRITCPHCGRVEIDDFELFDLEEMHAVACDACKRQYHLTIAECENCGEESVLTWTSVPTPGQISLATCVHCGNRFTNHADDIRSVGRGR